MNRLELALFALGLRYNCAPKTLRNKTFALVAHDRILLERK